VKYCFTIVMGTMFPFANYSVEGAHLLLREDKALMTLLSNGKVGLTAHSAAGAFTVARTNDSILCSIVLRG
jgi:hypothetical protein